MELITKSQKFSPKIAIIGIGGAGGNAINNMIKAGIKGVEFFVANTDVQDLNKSEAPNKIQLGAKITEGLGAGGDPEIGRKAAEETIKEIEDAFKDIKMLLISAGMGGGTGTGAAPIIARKAREMGILTLGIISLPFDFEGIQRKIIAQKGVKEFAETVDTLIVFPNNLISKCYNVGFLEAYKKTDEIITNAAQSISEIVDITGYQNLDFADLRATMKDAGYALIGTGIAEGEDRANKATRDAITNPLLKDIDLAGCKSLLISITVGADFSIQEFEQINEIVAGVTGNEQNRKAGVTFDQSLDSKMKVTIIATGLSASDAVKNLTEDNINTPQKQEPQTINTTINPQQNVINSNYMPERPPFISQNNSSSQKSYAAPTDFRKSEAPAIFKNQYN